MRKGTAALVFAVLLAGGQWGCDRNIAPFVPGEKPRQPDLSRIFPAPDEAAPIARGAAAPFAGSGGAGDADVGRPGAAVRGHVNLAESAKARGGTLFIIARRQGAVGGPPLAVLRIPDPSFPLAFEIGPDQVMIPGMRFEGTIGLSARLDADGDAMTRDAGDPQSGDPVAVVPGTLGVELLLR